MFQNCHAHVYFAKADHDRVTDLYQAIGRLFDVKLGVIHHKPVGPHSMAMFQVIFNRKQFGDVVPWLMENRNGLSVLVHADSENDYLDHTERVLWLGEPGAVKY